MTILSLNEIIDIFVMTAAVGFIFKDVFRTPAKQSDDEYDPLKDYEGIKAKFDWEGLKFAMLVTAPAIILHEFGHKVFGVLFGLHGVFHASYWGLAIGIFLKLIGSPFIFFVPAYVSYAAGGTYIQQAIIAFAGPGINLLLWLGCLVVLKSKIRITRKTRTILHLTSQINMFLFIFNMIPIPPFDGGHFFTNIYHAFFG
ncbi:MAG: M50 family metallopeptidase [Candidatus Woesearchaeota archaeon]